MWRRRSQTVKRACPSKFFPRHKWGSWASGSSTRRPMPHAWLKWPASARSSLPVPERWCFISVFYENWTKVRARTAFSHSRSQMASSKPQTLLPMRLCDWGSDVRSTSSSARLSWKRRAFSAIIDFSAQEYETPSTTNADAIQCE